MEFLGSIVVAVLEVLGLRQLDRIGDRRAGARGAWGFPAVILIAGLVGTVATVGRFLLERYEFYVTGSAWVPIAVGLTRGSRNPRPLRLGILLAQLVTGLVFLADAVTILSAILWFSMPRDLLAGGFDPDVHQTDIEALVLAVVAVIAIIADLTIIFGLGVRRQALVRARW